MRFGNVHFHSKLIVNLIMIIILIVELVVEFSIESDSTKILVV